MSYFTSAYWLGAPLNPQVHFGVFFKQLNLEFNTCSNQEGDANGEIQEISKNDRRDWMHIKLDKLGNVAHMNPLETLIITTTLFLLGKFFFTSLIFYGACYAGVFAFGIALGENKPAFMARVIEELTHHLYTDHQNLIEKGEDGNNIENILLQRKERVVRCKQIFTDTVTTPVSLNTAN